ncbi:MAG: DUF4129 domain-containing protein [Alphaproteobacteria bacterium]
MSWQKKRVWGAALLPAVPLFTVLSFAQSDDRFDAAFREMKRNERLQFDLPVPPPIQQNEPMDLPNWLEAIFEFLGGILSFLGGFLPYIFYGLLALGVGAVLYFVLRDVVKVRFPKKEKEKPQEAAAAPLYKPSDDEARVLLETVDALAASGNYAEAVHTLLFRSIQDIDLNRPNTIRRSLTSREISGLDILTRETREAFSLIGRVVENSFFGGSTLGRDDFEKCRAAYEQFAVPKAWAS